MSSSSHATTFPTFPTTTGSIEKSLERPDDRFPVPVSRAATASSRRRLKSRDSRLDAETQKGDNLSLFTHTNVDARTKHSDTQLDPHSSTRFPLKRRDATRRDDAERIRRRIDHVVVVTDDDGDRWGEKRPPCGGSKTTLSRR